MTSPEVACIYAALILNDDNIDITKDKIETLLNTSGIKIEKYMIEIFSEYFKNHDLSEIIERTPLYQNSKSSTTTSTTSDAQNQQGINNNNDKNEEEETETELDCGFDDLFN